VTVYGLLQDGGGEGVSRESWEQLLDADNPHKLMYSLQIVESLSRPPKFCCSSYDVINPTFMCLVSHFASFLLVSLWVQYYT